MERQVLVWLMRSHAASVHVLRKEIEGCVCGLAGAVLGS